jgi:hypothetical protein
MPIPFMEHLGGDMAIPVRDVIVRGILYDTII